MHSAFWACLLCLFVPAAQAGEVLSPPDINLAYLKEIHSSATCGDINGRPTRELFCNLAGASSYTPRGAYSYQLTEEGDERFAELRLGQEDQRVVQGGQNCEFCEAGTSAEHPAEFMVDGGSRWWQSPPLSRGMEYNKVNITIDLNQRFYVAYVWIEMANSPRPGAWVLERSNDHGVTWLPWQYFAESHSQCEEMFGRESLQPILEDDSVICSTEFSRIVPLENGEILISLIRDRPSRFNFTHSEKLQNFTLATNVRLRLLRTKTLQGHLMDLNIQKDPTITRRYYYAIKEIFMGGRCVCNGHAKTCDVLDQNKPNLLLCRCEHNTCGDQCEICCPGYDQKRWEQSRDGAPFECERCNCFGHSQECSYERELDDTKQSLDIHGEYKGGGRCRNCRDNTEGINCNECKFGFYNPEGVPMNVSYACRPCTCDPFMHSGDCRDGDGKCFCNERFEGEDCDKCAKGYYDYPECKPCDCFHNGTKDQICLPEEGQCPCLDHYGGVYCNECADTFHNISAGCIDCVCDEQGSLNRNCSKETGQCVCESAFAGLQCDRCEDGYSGFPDCKYCGCDETGTEGTICNKTTGECLCKDGYTSEHCEKCNDTWYGHPECKQCGCVGAGSESLECNQDSGQCQCAGNFSGRICDRCAAGFFGYPECRACNCDTRGSKGTTCGDSGACFCNPNFEGDKCDRCMDNFYNFPICEECNCDPRGVSADFAGCDKVPPGELCTCKKNVDGRICDSCTPTTYDLQHHHPEGCIGCDCHLNGTVSQLNECGQTDGQCKCKLYTGGRRCDMCEDGYFHLSGDNQLGCQECDCDVGGSMSPTCDRFTGQCQCKANIGERRCQQPLPKHYYPTLWHMMYEAEGGYDRERAPVRFASDNILFANYSWRGFAVFSPIQDEITMEVQVTKASVYQMLFHYVNPTQVEIDVKVDLIPYFTQGEQDVVQAGEFSLSPTETGPRTIALSGPNGAGPHPFVLNPGTWKITVATAQRLFLDYVVLLPSVYYEAPLLKAASGEPCTADDGETTCRDMRYPPIDAVYSATAADGLKDATGTALPLYGGKEVLKNLARVAFDGEDEFNITVDLSEMDGFYFALIEYYNPSNVSYNMTFGSAPGPGQGFAFANPCPYSFYCREVFTVGGRPSLFNLEVERNPVVLNVVSSASGNGSEGSTDADLGIVAIHFLPVDSFYTEILVPKEMCVKKGERCLEQQYPSAPDSQQLEAESGANENDSIAGDKLPFHVSNAASVSVVALHAAQATIEVNGTVPTPGHYMFVVHYYNPENPAGSIQVLLQTEYAFESRLHFKHCPSVSGCKAMMVDKKEPRRREFWVGSKYTLTFIYDDTSKAPVYLDAITVVPYQSFSNDLLKPLTVESAGQFINNCKEQHFKNSPETVSDFCKTRVFSLTADVNNGALACLCNEQGSTSMDCATYGGQCDCKANVIGRQCDRCKPNHHSFPECKPCSCATGEQCDEQTGQCQCPLHVEGRGCEKCVGNAFGYDPLIGCQLCGCHPSGSLNDRELKCDPDSGQCLCKPNISGRKCDTCAPGYYGFPHCYQCVCELAGSTPQICNQTTSECICKENAYGQSCERCKVGTFNLEQRNLEGCTDCFCFGKTDRCTSAQMLNLKITELAGWLPSDSNASISMTPSMIEIGIEATSESPVYFVAPSLYLGKQILSYGSNITYGISSQPASDDSQLVVFPEVRLKGHNLTLEHWSMEQPADPKKPFIVVAPLIPMKWSHADGSGGVSREQLMMVLNDLQSMEVKASYYDNISSAKLSAFEMGSAELRAFGNNHLMTERGMAKSVEACECPPPYQGYSCEECADGYYRVKGGAYLGSCVPCQCNGHSNTCDKETGVCADCRYDTRGDHCELCAVGHYGNASAGTPYDCQICPCPVAGEGGNFASSCEMSEMGHLLSCTCLPGYTTHLCSRCDIGYHGRPDQPNGKCDKCDCSGNNDLTNPQACDAYTGTCYLCQNNTAGRMCEICEPWYYGDALAAKNCTECTCSQCGSAYCDNNSGKCGCHPLIEGDNCDKCARNAWGFSKCQGCRMCGCGLASMSQQCDLETGKCLCMSGVEGDRCDRCKNGYWNYGPSGCTKCDCEADLSMGTVCDVRSGHCQCQQGAIGARCDTCDKGYLRIYEMGCKRCDPCVHGLKASVEQLEEMGQLANTSLGNVSTAALTGARLYRINASLHTLLPKAKGLIKSDDADGLETMIGDVTAEKDSIETVMHKAERSREDGNRTNERIVSLVKKTEVMAQQCADKKRGALAAVDDLKSLEGGISGETPAQAANNRAQLTAQAQQLLNEMKETSFDENLNKTTNELAAAEDDATVDAFIEQNQNASINKKRVKGNLGKMFRRLGEHADFLAEVDEQLAEASEINRKTKSNLITTLVNEVSGDVKKSTQNIKEAEKLLSDAQDAMQNIGDTDAQVDLTEKLNDTITQLEDATIVSSDGMSNLTSLLPEVRQKAERLAQEAQNIAGRLGHSVLTAENSVRAAESYTDIVKQLIDAGVAAQAAVDAVNDVTTGITVANETQKVKQESAELLRTATEVRQEVINNLTDTMAALDIKVNQTLADIRSANGPLDKIISEANDRIKGSHDETLAAAESKAKEATETAKSVSDTVTEMSDKIAKLVNLSSVGVNNVAGTGRDLKSAKNQLRQVAEIVPQAIGNLTELQEVVANATKKLNGVEDQLDSLRRKLALTKDMANRVKVGAKFAPDSNLQLENPPRIERSAAHSDIKLYFKTKAANGLLFYFGNKIGTHGAQGLPSDDFIAVDLERGRPRLIIDLGNDKPTVFTSDAFVGDGNWHRLTVKRTGKTAQMIIEKHDQKTPTVTEGSVEGSKSVLDLNQQLSGFYIGGVPDSARLHPYLRNHHLVGEVEGVSFHGDPVGLWNFAHNGMRNVQGAMGRNQLKVPQTSVGVTLNGDGYLVMQRGGWNPRTDASISLSFRSYAPVGLMIYVGEERDFLSIHLLDGYVALQFDFGSGTGRIRSNNRYNDGNWHMLHVSRTHKDATLIVDESDEVKGSSPGDMFELNMGDDYYVGGVPNSIAIKIPQKRFNGCIDKLQLDNGAVNLNNARIAKGIEPGCVDTAVRVVGSDQEESSVNFANVTLNAEVELTLRFRTVQSAGLIAHLSNEAKTNVLTLILEDGFLKLISTGDGTCPTCPNKPLAVELTEASDGQWHFVTVSRNTDRLRLDVDDLYSAEAFLNDAADIPTINGDFYLAGGVTDVGVPTLIGCIGDVTFNGQLMNFGDAEYEQVSMTGCPMTVASQEAPSGDGASMLTTSEVSGVSVIDGFPVVRPTEKQEKHNVGFEYIADKLPDKPRRHRLATLRLRPPTTTVRKPFTECALKTTPMGEREDSTGYRFGLQPHSRLEFDRLPSPFDTSGNFVLEFRTTASSGLLLFATNDRQTDYVALQMHQGRLIYSFDSGSGAAIIESTDAYVDGEWHTVNMTRRGTFGELFVNGIFQGQNYSAEGTDSVDTKPPFYVGAVPQDVLPFVTKLIEKWSSAMVSNGGGFAGCMRDFRLNNQPLGEPTRSIAVKPCAEYTEDGMYFGRQGGYAVLRDRLNVGDSFSLEISLKPRVQQAVILAVSAGMGDYLTLQMLKGGRMVFRLAMDNGGDTHVLEFNSTQPAKLCDGHWHTIKVYKARNLMTIAVDGVSKLTIIRSASRSLQINTNDPLYLGGVPDTYKTRGLDTADAYIGCVRVVSMGSRPRQRKNVLFDQVQIFGDVKRSQCPVN